MPVHNLTPTYVLRLKPRKKIYIIRDKKIKGLCVRVMPSGLKSYALEIRRRDKVSGKLFTHRETLGNTDAMSLEEARGTARSRIKTLILAMGGSSPDKSGEKVKFKPLAELTFSRYERQWKPSTMRINGYYLKNQILPFFGDMIVADITKSDVKRWFDGLSHIKTTANRALPVLSTIFREAEEMGLREEDSNPASGTRRYKSRTCERVLTDDELRRLWAVLDDLQESIPHYVAIIRLIILTGARKSEIVGLQWRYYRGGHLHLPDSKTGPKTLYLSSFAREVLESVKTRRCKFVFPGKSRKKPIFGLDDIWMMVREEAGLNDVRLHDLRHTYASIAIRSKISLNAIGVLLGHDRADTTARYAHMDDAMMFEAIDTIGATMVDDDEGDLS
jgi:integrase